jgi:divalent metal cation (Fe/Co/Zn/Cd) transporter
MQDVIIMENIIPCICTAIPFITCLSYYSFGLIYADIIGQIFNGICQLYIVFRVQKKNMKILLGKSVHNIHKIVKTLKKSQPVTEVTELKSEYLGTDLLKVSASIKYDPDKISEMIIGHCISNIKDITLDPDEQQKIFDLILKFNRLMLTYNAEVIQNIEKDIQKVFKDASVINLEVSSLNIKKKYEHLPFIVLSESDSESKELKL